MCVPSLQRNFPSINNTLRLLLSKISSSTTHTLPNTPVSQYSTHSPNTPRTHAADVSEVLPTGLEFVPLLTAEEPVVQSAASCMRIALAVTGKEFALIAEHLPHELRRLAVSGAVFARMSPDQKTELVHVMQELVGRAVECFCFVQGCV